ncbi:hypothetical protein V6N13_001692 [Hibiscus sabdariffa]|uniref:Uncharacterized protein n=1 Tax=Hibiscus sabdariffa TaxID=183260 RepID=A0ABR2GA07_9ROSI
MSNPSVSPSHDSSKLVICPSGRPSDLDASRLEQCFLRCDDQTSNGVRTNEKLDGGNVGDAFMQGVGNIGEDDAVMVGSESMIREVEPLFDGTAMATNRSRIPQRKSREI